MNLFTDYFLPRLAQNAQKSVGLIEAIADGYKICHPDKLDGIPVKSVLVHGDDHYLSQKQDPPFTPTTGSSLRNLSCEKQNLTLTSMRDKSNIVYESVNGKQNLTVDAIETHINKAIKSLSSSEITDKYIEEKIKTLKSNDIEHRSNAIISLINYIITGSKTFPENETKYFYETDSETVLCSVRLGNHFAKNNIIAKKEAELEIEPLNRISIISPNARLTSNLANRHINVSTKFDSSNAIERTEIVINPEKVKFEKNQNIGKYREMWLNIASILRKMFSEQNLRCKILGQISLKLSKSLQKIMDVYQLNTNGSVLKNGMEIQSTEANEINGVN